MPNTKGYLFGKFCGRLKLFNDHDCCAADQTRSNVRIASNARCNRLGPIESGPKIASNALPHRDAQSNRQRPTGDRRCLFVRALGQFVPMRFGINFDVIEDSLANHRLDAALVKARR